MSERYLFGPVTAEFADENLHGEREAGNCLAFIVEAKRSKKGTLNFLRGFAGRKLTIGGAELTMTEVVAEKPFAG
jgi:hypothetical protein